MSKRLRNKTILEICNENNLKGPLLTNIIDEYVSKRKIRATLEIIAKALSSTLGPDGSTSILQDPAKQHLVSKDGLDVISKLTFQDEISRTVLDLVKTVSSSQVVSVGDGSTSAIIVANSLYQALTDSENVEKLKYVSPKAITDMLNVISDYVETKIREKSNKVSDDCHELELIASIAMNNDDNIGKILKDVYKKIGINGFISTDVKENYEIDTVEYKKGINWDRGYIDQAFIERYDTPKCIFDNCEVFLTNGSITFQDIETLYAPLIKQICGIEKKQLLIVANFIDDESRNWFINTRQTYKLGKPELQFIVTDIEQTTETGINKLLDLSLLCGCEIYRKGLNKPEEVTVRLMKEYTKADKRKFIGSSVKVSVSKYKTDVLCDDKLLSQESLERKNKEIKTIIDKIEKINNFELDTFENTSNLFSLKSRLTNLENLSAIYHVGGKTLQERNSRERLIEDAIYACSSALEYGYNVGGNTVIPIILRENKEEIINLLQNKFPYLKCNIDFYIFFVELIESSFLESYVSVLENSEILTDDEISNIINDIFINKKFYNLKTHESEDFDKTLVINSSNTDIQIMRSCISLIGLLATSNQVITLNYTLDNVDH